MVREKFRNSRKSKVRGAMTDRFFLWLPESSADPCRNLFGGPIVNAIVNLYIAIVWGPTRINSVLTCTMVHVYVLEYHMVPYQYWYTHVDHDE